MSNSKMFKCLEGRKFFTEGTEYLNTMFIIDNMTFLSPDNDKDALEIAMVEDAMSSILAMPRFEKVDFAHLWAIKNGLKKYAGQLESMGYDIPIAPEEPEEPEYACNGDCDNCCISDTISCEDASAASISYAKAFTVYQKELKAYDNAWFNLVRQFKADKFGYRAILFLKKDNLQTKLVKMLDPESLVVVLCPYYYEIMTPDEYLNDYKKVVSVVNFENKLADYVTKDHGMYKRYLGYIQAYDHPGAHLQLERPVTDTSSVKQYEVFATKDEKQIYNIFTDEYHDKSVKFDSSLYSYVSARHPGYITGGMKANSHSWHAYKKWEVEQVFTDVVVEEDYFVLHPEEATFYALDVHDCPKCGKKIRLSLYSPTTTCFFCHEEFRNPYCITDVDPDWGVDTEAKDLEEYDDPEDEQDEDSGVVTHDDLTEAEKAADKAAFMAILKAHPLYRKVWVDVKSYKFHNWTVWCSLQYRQ